MHPIPINLAVEDPLSEAVLRKILAYSDRNYTIGQYYNRGGVGYLKRTIRGFNKAAKGTPFLVLADLDATECAPILIREGLPVPKHPNLIFRIAVREVEAWLLADRNNFAKFLGVSKDLIPMDVDAIPDPKYLLLQLARRSKKRNIRETIVSQSGSKAKIGPDYNGRLILFVETSWNIDEAMQHSSGLKRMVKAVSNFQPTYR